MCIDEKIEQNIIDLMSKRHSTTIQSTVYKTTYTGIVYANDCTDGECGTDDEGAAVCIYT